MKAKKLLIIIAVLFSLNLLAQEKNALNTGNIKGKVIDAKTQESLPGVNIIIKNTKKGTVSDARGYYELKNIPNGKKLISVSFIGYETYVYKTDLNNDTIKKDFYLSPTCHNLNTVVVTGTRTPKTLKNTPVITRVITEKQLQEIDAVTVLDALEAVIPGINFTPDGHGDNLQIQGLGNDYILILIDGERLVGETRGNVNFSRLNTSNIKQIEIVNGASSSLYGSNAIGAVINIITKNVERPIEGNIRTRYSNYNDLTLDAGFGFKYKKLSSKTNLNRKSTDGYDITPETPTVQTVKKNIDYSIVQTLGYKFNEKLNIKLNGSLYQHEVFNHEESMNSSHRKDYNYTCGGKLIYLPNKKHKLTLSGHSDIFNGYKIYEKKDNKKELGSDYSFTAYRAIDNYILNDKLNFVFGTELNTEKLYSLQLFGEEGSTKNSHDVNVFIQTDWEIIKKISVIAGLRFNNHVNYGSHLTPKISFMCPLKSWRIRGTVGSGYKAPSLKELYYDFDHHGMFHIYGNKDLKPEESYYYSLSTEFTKNKFNASINIFQNNIDNKIDKVDRYNSITGMLEKHLLNIEQARIRGIDFITDFHISKHFFLKAAYNFADAEDMNTGLQLYGNSKHSGTLCFTFKSLKPEHPLCITLTARGSSKKLYQYVTEEKNETTGETEEVIYKNSGDPYMLWKIIINRTMWSKGEKRLGLSAGINNILDYTDNENKTTIDPGRRYFISMNFNF